MRGQFLSACACFGALFAISEAEARVFVHIDLSSQTMHVRSNSGSYDWPISTARPGYRTPRGSYRPQMLVRMHYSRKYHMSPMPYSIFFAGGYAIHGTYETRWLGRPASHGCIRLAPGNAALLYHMVQREGAAISITGTPPVYYASAGRRSRDYTWHHKQQRWLAYSPAQPPAAVNAWQTNPVWPAWPW